MPHTCASSSIYSSMVHKYAKKPRKSGSRKSDCCSNNTYSFGMALSVDTQHIFATTEIKFISHSNQPKLFHPNTITLSCKCRVGIYHFYGTGWTISTGYEDDAFSFRFSNKRKVCFFSNVHVGWNDTIFFESVIFCWLKTQLYERGEAQRNVKFIV